jgi:RNA-binding protein
VTPLTNSQTRQLKAQAQRLQATFRVGKQGLGAEFIAALDAALKHHELVKVKFDAYKDERRTLSAQMAERTGSQCIWIVGHVAVLFRPKPAEP